MSLLSSKARKAKNYVESLQDVEASLKVILLVLKLTVLKHIC